MTGRENSEDRFEEQWRDAFEEWSAEPPKAVWSEIDRKLAYHDLSAYKAKAVMYRWVAAAIVLLFVSYGAIQYYGTSDNYIISAAATIDSPNPTESYKWSLKGRQSDVNGEQNDRGGGSSTNIATVLAEGNTSNSEIPGKEEQVERRYETYQVASLEPSFKAQTTYVDKHLYYLPVFQFHKKKKTTDRSKYWAGVDVGSGNFNPNYSSTASSLNSNLGVNPEAGFSLNSNSAFDSESPTVRENMSSGETVTMGVNFGVKLGNKWTLESGVQYARSDAMTETNVIIKSNSFQEVIPATVQGKRVPAVEQVVARETMVEYDYQDVDMSNVFEFTSIPVKAGYLLLDKKFSMELNAGVVANIYMGNRLSTEDPNVAELTIGPGDASPYRDLSFSGLAGVEFGYRFMKRLDVIVEPNYRQSINTLTKSNSNFIANPSGFALTTGLRYNFN
jgi:hypothetical protein